MKFIDANFSHLFNTYGSLSEMLIFATIRLNGVRILAVARSFTRKDSDRLSSARLELQPGAAARSCCSFPCSVPFTPFAAQNPFDDAVHNAMKAHQRQGQVLTFLAVAVGIETTSH